MLSTLLLFALSKPWLAHQKYFNIFSDLNLTFLSFRYKILLVDQAGVEPASRTLFSLLHTAIIFGGGRGNRTLLVKILARDLRSPLTAPINYGAPSRSRTGTPESEGFSYHYSFHYQLLTVCGLDYTFTVSFDLRCLPSSLYTFLFLGLARYWHFKAFTEFDRFYSYRFQ